MHLKVTSGPMFLGKTELIMAEARKEKRFGIEPVVLKPRKDRRYTDKAELKTHDGRTYPCTLVDTFDDIMKYVDDGVCIKIDELFLIKGDALKFFKGLVNVNVDIHAFGLDLDSNGETWPNMNVAHAYADIVDKMFASNPQGEVIKFTQKLKATGNKEDVGGKKDYKAVTAKDWIPQS